MEFHATFVKRDIEQSIASIDDKLEINRAMDNVTRLKNDSEEQRFYSPMLGMELAMPEWEALITILALGLVIIITIVGKNDVVLAIIKSIWQIILSTHDVLYVVLQCIYLIGNILVIVSVFTHSPLKITPNYFIVSLAFSDLTLSIVVLPLNVILHVVGKWHFGVVVCKMWLTSDVLCCTVSILNLCAIALDR